MRRAVHALVAVLALLLAPPVLSAEDFVIGYLQQKKDTRYGRKRAYARYLTHALGRPYTAAKVALKEVRFHGSGAGVEFKLKRVKGKDASALAESVRDMKAQGVHFFIADLPAQSLSQLARQTADADVTLFNVSARDDVLRADACHSHLFHIIPSQAMLHDALAQYLVSKKWREALLLVGPEPADQQLAAAFERSAKRFGMKIAARRDFLLTNDPRQREQGNIALLTGGEDYDVVYIADSDGEFAREAPFRTLLPRPIVGSEGLAAAAWHWAWERHGAPQLEKRFEKVAKRHMRSVDWAAWMAVKTIADAVQVTSSADPAVLRKQLLDQSLVLDAFKGNRVNFRPWNNQLRQPILLVTHNWVVERAPIKGFLHHSHDLDSLGVDEPESKCRF